MKGAVNILTTTINTPIGHNSATIVMISEGMESKQLKKHSSNCANEFIMYVTRRRKK